MVILLLTVMFVRRNLDLATQGAQAAIGQKGCNSPMGTISMQVLLTDTLYFLFLSLTVFGLLHPSSFCQELTLYVCFAIG